MEWFSENWLDVTTTILGLLYIWLEYRVNILLWVVGIIMPALDIALYWQHGLYGDSALSVYYLGAAIYGYVVWYVKDRKSSHAPETTLTVRNMPLRLYLPATLVFAIAWVITWYVLMTFTNSTVPVLDGFTNAMSIIGLWALSRKYVQQWIFWIVVDGVCTYLYIIKGIPFKAGLYGLYVVIAVAGYYKWKKLAIAQ